MEQSRYDCALVWFRRDLRSHDHAALYHALAQAHRVYCAFVFDTEILDALEARQDRRVEFIWESVAELKGELERLGGGLVVRHGRAREQIPALESMGFARTNLKDLRMPTGMSGARVLFQDFLTRMPRYRERRDYPAVKGPSYLATCTIACAWSQPRSW